MARRMKRGSTITPTTLTLPARLNGARMKATTYSGKSSKRPANRMVIWMTWSQRKKIVFWVLGGSLSSTSSMT
eukprot:6161733-Prymnesium_polylepis.1